MQSISIVEDNYGQTYCVVQPLSCFQSATHIRRQHLIQCKFCKSLALPNLNTAKFECAVCKCFTELTHATKLAQQFQIQKQGAAQIILTQQVPKTANANTSNLHSQDSHLAAQPKALKILILFQMGIGEQFNLGMQCLNDIFPKHPNIQISLLLYNPQHLLLIQLEKDGRLIQINQHSFELINDKFYAPNSQTLGQLFQVLQNVSPKPKQKQKQKSVNNSTKILFNVLQAVYHSSVVVLWFGNITENMQIPPNSLHFYKDLYCFVKVPYSLNSESQIQSMNSLNKNGNKIKYVLKTDKPQTVIQKLHYGLYQIFGNEAVSNIKVEASRQKKYPPEILTNKHRLLGSMRNCILVKLGKMEKAQNIQIRYKFTEILKNIEEQKQQNEELQQNAKGKIIVVNFKYTENQKQERQLQKYIKLFKFVKMNPNPTQLRQLPINQNTDIDIAQFYRQSSFIQKQQLLCNIENPNCIYIVWPWVGIGKQKGSGKKVKLMYYLTGHFINAKANAHQKLKVQLNQNQNQNQIQHQIQNQIQNQQGELLEKIENLNELCQVLYCPRNEHLSSYYAQIEQETCPPSHLTESDSEEEQFSQRCYEFNVK